MLQVLIFIVFTVIMFIYLLFCCLELQLINSISICCQEFFISFELNVL